MPITSSGEDVQIFTAVYFWKVDEINEKLQVFLTSPEVLKIEFSVETFPRHSERSSTLKVVFTGRGLSGACFYVDCHDKGAKFFESWGEPYKEQEIISTSSM